LLLIVPLKKEEEEGSIQREPKEPGLSFQPALGLYVGIGAPAITRTGHIHQCILKFLIFFFRFFSEFFILS